MYTKKIMVLGGGSSQINLIKECVRQGYHTILADINEQAPGRAFCSSFERASTFDIDAVIKAAEINKIDAVMTAGTDQPVLTCAAAACKLNLPGFLDTETALSVTNKKIMKNIFSDFSIKTAPFAFLNKDFKKSELDHLKAPYVIKPLDSQGQRGVFKVDSISEIKSLFENVLSYSKEKEIIAENYYDSDEITVSGWVCSGKIYIFTVTDRVTFDNPPTIGVCASHIFPSPYLFSHQSEIIETTVSIVKNFGIKNGPIYFQYLIGKNGLQVNEIACRLGGAYEDEFIPLLTGIDLRKLLIKGSLGEEITDTDFKNLVPVNEWREDNKTRSKETEFTKKRSFINYGKYVSVPLIFCRSGLISDLASPDNRKIKSLANFSFLQEKGTWIRELNNSTQRAAYAVLLSENVQDLNRDVKKLFKAAAVYDSEGNNMLMKNHGLSLYCDRRRFS